MADTEPDPDPDPDPDPATGAAGVVDGVAIGCAFPFEANSIARAARLRVPATMYTMSSQYCFKRARDGLIDRYNCAKRASVPDNASSTS